MAARAPSRIAGRLREGLQRAREAAGLAVRVRRGDRAAARQRRARHRRVLRVAVRSLPGDQRGRVDGRHGHRLLRAAAARQPHAHVALPLSDLRGAAGPAGDRPLVGVPRPQAQAAARPDRGQPGRPLPRPGRHRDGSGAAQGARDRLGRRRGRALLPAHPGFRPGAAPERRAPARGLRGPERASLPLPRQAPHPARGIAARARLDAGHQGLGTAPSGQGAALHEREPELRVLPGTARRPARGRSARSACRSRRSAPSPSIRA